MTQEAIRKLILKALYSDEWLYNYLVLKGGNALSLVYKVGNRSSLDLDFSIQGDFNDTDEVSRRIEKTLRNTFSKVDITVFDFELLRKPRNTNTPWWGGYAAEFKLIPNPLASSLSFRIDDMRRQALKVGPGSQRRKYSIEISKFEYVRDAIRKDVDGFGVRVYSPVLLAVEKLRALLQQHPDYPQIPKSSKRSRSRDLYDIWVISDAFVVRIEMYLATVQAVFDAKKVDMSLLSRFREMRALHMSSWSDVENSVARGLEEFDFYFEFVADAAESLYSRWVEHTP